MIEKSLYDWISSVTDLPTVQASYSGDRLETDHVTFTILSMTTPREMTRNKRRRADGVGEYVIDVSSEVEVQIDAYGYKSYNEIMKLSASRLDWYARNKLGECLMLKGSGSILNTQFINDSQHEDRWTGTFTFEYGLEIVQCLDEIKEFILKGCVDHAISSDPADILDSCGKFSIERRDIDFNAQASNIYLVDSTNVPITVTSPQNPVKNQVFTVTDEAAVSMTNSITVLFGTDKFYGEALGSFTLNCDGATTSFLYTGPETGWIKLS